MNVLLATGGRVSPDNAGFKLAFGRNKWETWVQREEYYQDR
jgi:hypothetical protein